MTRALKYSNHPPEKFLIVDTLYTESNMEGNTNQVKYVQSINGRESDNSRGCGAPQKENPAMVNASLLHY